VTDPSLGTIAGVSSAPSPKERALSGYIGQLYELSRLAVRATPQAIPGGGASQLTGIATMDDSSVLLLSGADLQWSPAAFPLVAMSPLGVATADNPQTNSTATVTGSYLGEQASTRLLVSLTQPKFPQLFISRSGQKIIISWAGGGMLESAAALGGPDQSTGDSSGVFITEASRAVRFYRVREQPVRRGVSSRGSQRPRMPTNNHEWAAFMLTDLRRSVLARRGLRPGLTRMARIATNL
jgi:hypothetical protein